MNNCRAPIPCTSSTLYSNENTHHMLAHHSVRITGRLRKLPIHCYSNAVPNCPGGSRSFSRVFVHCRWCFTHGGNRKLSVREHLEFRVRQRQSANGRARYLRTSQNSKSDQSTSDFAARITRLPTYNRFPEHACQSTRPGDTYDDRLPLLLRRSPVPVC